MSEIEDLPYRAEYSKSGRASCRACKQPIAKDVLRLAVMVQSPMFDGKTPNWYHYMCFFGKQRPKSSADIAHLESLRWEDQEKIKKKIEEYKNVAVEPAKVKGKKRNGKAAGALGDFCIEYAKSGRAMCRGCEQKILKDEVRISKKDYESEIGRRYGGQDLWHHIDCFAKLRHTLNFCVSGTVLPGFKTLTKEDQQKVQAALPQIEPIKKEKTEDEADGPSEPKKSKKDEEEDEKKKQSKLMFKYRDALQRNLGKRELSLLLEHNNQEVPAGTSSMLDRLSDIMTFGALLPCTECKEGQLVFRSGVGYQCVGNLTEWTKCEHMQDEPQRAPFKVPEELAQKYTFLENYKYKPRGKRLFSKAAPSTSAVKKEDDVDAGPRISRPLPPLYNLEFVVNVGVPDRKDVMKEIEKLGGKVVSKVHEKLAAVVATEEQVEKMGSKVKQAKEMDIQVVSVEFLEKVKKTDITATDIIQTENICDWGSNVKSRVPDVTKSVPKKSKSGSMFTKSVPSKVKLTVKGGMAVDPDSGLESIAHVYKKGKDVYNAVLGLTDIQSGKNSYYKLQLLQADSGNRFWCFRAWGRIGTTIGGNKLTEGTLHDMMQEFKFVYEDKTGNMWENRENFSKVPGKLYPIDVDYENDDEAAQTASSSVPSKLPEPVQNLVQMIFDIDTMKKVMMEFELDMEKMPLGKLSKRQLQHAMSVLTDLQELVKNSGSRAQFVDASNRFYTLLPHDFGMNAPPLIDSDEKIKEKLTMVESLMEMEVAYNLLKSNKEGAKESSGEKNPIDAKYDKLKTEICVVEKDSEEFRVLQEYVKNTHGETHKSYELEVLEAFKVKRQGEDKRYKPFRKMHNRKLLWHGSRLTNFAGILSQGLRIAPPEAPVTGYMFGKGIYFADMVTKSANYCCTTPQSPVGLMLLCEVALGNMHECANAEYIEKLPPGKHSTKGVGRICPDPEASHKRDDGVEIPLGKSVKTNKDNLALYYNEYIVYDVAQVNIQYLLKMNFKYKY